MLNFYFPNQFKKDLKVAEKRRCNMDVMNETIAKIIFEEPLPERCRPHNLSGNWSNFTECHVLNDWVLIYRYTDEGVVFSRAGTHSDLF